MWEDEYSKRKKTNRILIIISAVLAIVLIVGMVAVTTKSSNVKEVLAVSSEQSQAQNNEQKADVINRIEADYKNDMDTVNAYIPGIVCWGDKLTGGSESGVSYASALQDLIDENICDLYDFRGTLDYADNVSRVEWDDYKVEIPVVNMGTGEESTNTILGRNGAVPYVLMESVTIPADTNPVRVSLMSATGMKVAPLTQGDGGVNNVVINGIEGTLKLADSGYTFTRLEAGEETTAPANTVVETAASSMYRDYIPVIFIGTYGGFDNADTLIEQQKAIIDHQVGENDRYIVLGLYQFDNSYNNYSYVYEEYEEAMQKAFGEHFINLRKYLISDAADDLKIELTSGDKEQIQQGKVPNSLRSSSGSTELSAAVYKQIGKVIYDRMDQLGYFDEVNEELGIDDVVAQIKQNELDQKLNSTNG